MLGQPGHNTRPHAWSPPSFLGMNAWMTSKLNAALIRTLRGSLMCLAYFFDMVPNGVFHNQALADVWSTDAGIKCLYCIT